jgi:hypothetical protein
MTDRYEYVREVKWTLLQILAWGVIICGIAYFLGVGWRIPGLLLGVGTSAIYFLLISYRVYKSAELSVIKAISYMRVGWLVRLSFIAMMLLLSIKIPLFDFISAVLGLFSLQIIMLVNASAIVIKSFFDSNRSL